MNDEALPDLIHTEAELDAVMTQPTAALTAFVRTLRGPLVVLGAPVPAATAPYPRRATPI